MDSVVLFLYLYVGIPIQEPQLSSKVGPFDPSGCDPLRVGFGQSGPGIRLRSGEPEARLSQPNYAFLKCPTQLLSLGHGPGFNSRVEFLDQLSCYVCYDSFNMLSFPSFFLLLAQIKEVVIFTVLRNLLQTRKFSI